MTILNAMSLFSFGYTAFETLETRQDVLVKPYQEMPGEETGVQAKTIRICKGVVSVFYDCLSANDHYG
jgi:hypothetical protein